MKKLENIKIIFIDIDGTLTDSNKQLHSANIEAIKKVTDKNIYVVLCSGRTNQYVCDFSKKTNASNYVICCNGAFIYDYKNDKDIFSSKLNFNDVTTLWDYCLEHKLGCILNTKNKRYSNNYLYNVHDNSIETIRELSEVQEDIYQIVIDSNNYYKIKDVDEVIKKTESLGIANTSISFVDKIIDSNKYFFDVVNKNINKGDAIKYLLEYLGIKKEEAVCIGDHINDYQMFHEVGFKVAMGNANSELMKKSDYVTLSNDEDGVAYFLNHYI